MPQNQAGSVYVPQLARTGEPGLKTPSQYDDEQAARNEVAQAQEVRRLTLTQAAETQRAKLAEARAQQEKQAWMTQAMRTYVHDNGRPDLDAIADAMSQKYPADAVEFRRGVTLDRQRAAQTKKLEFENHRDIGQMSGRMLRTANPENYASVRQAIVQLDPDADRMLPPQFDETAVQQIIQRSDALAGDFDEKAKATDDFSDAPLKWFARNAPTIRSQEDLDQLYDDATLRMKAPELRELKRAYGVQYTPEWNANAEQVALSFQKQPTSSSDVSWQEKTQMVNGKLTTVYFNPKTRQMVDGQGNDVSAQVKPVPPQSGGTGGAVDDPVATLSIDPTSQNILSQTGLSINAFRLLTGQGSQLPRDQATRNKAAAEAQKWARDHNVDIATLPSQYKTYNDVLSANISRLNNTKIMESEILGTIDNLKSVAKDADLGRLNIANVIKIWSGQQVNDSLAQQYALHLSQLRNELSAYYAATQGRTGNNITIQDQRDAEMVLRNGMAAGSLTGLQKAIENSTGKMGTVMQGSVDRTRKEVWNLFGVGGNLKTDGSTNAQKPTYKVGQEVTIKGVKHRITEVFPNGTFNAVPVVVR